MHGISEDQVVERALCVSVPQIVPQFAEPKVLNIPDGTEPHAVVHPDGVSRGATSSARECVPGRGG